MARTKATITLDREKAALAQAMTGAESMSDAVDLALDRLIRAERTRRDVEAYRGSPATADEDRWGDQPVQLDLDDDDVDYEALYRETFGEDS